MASQKREQAPALQSLKSGPPRKPIRDTNSVPPDRVGAGGRRPLRRKEKGVHDVACPYTGLEPLTHDFAPPFFVLRIFLNLRLKTDN